MLFTYFLHHIFSFLIYSNNCENKEKIKIIFSVSLGLVTLSKDHLRLFICVLYNFSTNREEEEEGAITNPDGTKMEQPEQTGEDGDKKEGEEEEEGPQFTEDEEAIVQYLKEDEPLPPELLDKIVADWWNKDPFK